jgi:hypothetical protein
MCIIVCLSLRLLLRHFEWTGAAYTQQGLKKVGRGPALSSSAVGGVYGPISVSSDGRTVLVGSSYEKGSYTGAAYLWGRDAAGVPANDWVQIGDDLSYSAIQPMARTGHAVGLSGDATQIAVGGQWHNACSLRIRCPVLVFATLAGSPSLTDLWYRLCVCVSPSCSAPYMDNLVGATFAGYLRITCENCPPGNYWSVDDATSGR